jgi:hypothetical protein
MGGVSGSVAGGLIPTRQSGIIITDDDSDGVGVELEHIEALNKKLGLE